MSAKSAAYEIVMRIKTELGNSMADMNAFASKAKAKLTEVDKVSRKVGKGGVGNLPMGFPGPLPGPDIIKTRGRKKRAGTGPGDVAQMGRITDAKANIQQILGSKDELLDPTRLQYGPGAKGGVLIKAQHKQWMELNGMMQQVTQTSVGLGNNLRHAAMNAQLQNTSMTALQPAIRYTSTHMEDHGRISRSVSDTYDMMNGQYRLMGSRIKDVSRPHERFKMHLLSLMFFGMAVKAMFMGYIQQVLQLTGVTDMLSATINLVLLPAILPLLPMMYGLLISIMELSPEIRQILGLSLIALTVAGAILMTIGMVGLGIQGIKIALVECGLVAEGTIGTFAILKGIGGKIYGEILKLIAGITMVKLVLTVVLVGTIVNAKDIIWGGIKLILGGVWHILEGAYDVLEGVFKVVWGIITNNKDMIMEGFVSFMAGLGTLIFGGLGYIIIGIVQICVGLVAGIIRLGINIISIAVWIVDSLISTVLQGLTDFLGIDFIGGYTKIVQEVDNFLFKPIRELFEAWIGGMTSGFDRLRSGLDDLTGIFSYLKGETTKTKKKNEEATSSFEGLGTGVNTAVDSLKELNRDLDTFFNTTLTDSTNGLEDQTSVLGDTTWSYKELNTGVKESTRSIYEFTSEAKDNTSQLKDTIQFAGALKSEIGMLEEQFDFASINLSNFGDGLDTTKTKAKNAHIELTRLKEVLKDSELSRAKLYENTTLGSMGSSSLRNTSPNSTTGGSTISTYAPTYHIDATLTNGMDVETMIDEIHSRDLDSLRRHLIR